MGLSIKITKCVRNILENHHARIWLEIFKEMKHDEKSWKWKTAQNCQQYK